MTKNGQQQLGKTLWNIADQLRGAMNADDFRDYMLSFLFLRYLSGNYEESAKKELGRDYPDDTPSDVMSKLKVNTPLEIWYKENPDDVVDFEKQMRRKVHYVVKPEFLWNNVTELARTHDGELLEKLSKGFKYIENESFDNSFQGLFSEINLNSEKLGKTPTDRNKKLCTIILKDAESQGLLLLDDMSGHPSMLKYMNDGYEVITF